MSIAELTLFKLMFAVDVKVWVWNVENAEMHGFLKDKNLSDDIIQTRAEPSTGNYGSFYFLWFKVYLLAWSCSMNPTESCLSLLHPSNILMS